MTAEQRTAYFKQQDKWVKDGLIKKKPKGAGATSNKNAVVKEVVTEMMGALREPDAPSSPPASTSNEDLAPYEDRVLKFLNSKISVIRRSVCGMDAATVRAALQSSPSNGIINCGADTCLLGSAFLMLSHSDRLTNVSGFDAALVKKDLKIGTGVAAFDLPDGETMLVMINEAIDHTGQENTMLSSNQLRHNGCDVDDTYPLFIIQGKPGTFRIALGDNELIFTMVNGLASLTFRYPTEEELEDKNIRVMCLTSSAQWDQENLNGNNFLPRADLHYANRHTSHIADEVIFDGDEFYDTSNSEYEDDVDTDSDLPSVTPTV